MWLSAKHGRLLQQYREAVRLRSELLQMREELVKVQANRIAELENMIGLRAFAGPMLMNEPFMPNRRGA